MSNPVRSYSDIRLRWIAGHMYPKDALADSRIRGMASEILRLRDLLRSADMHLAAYRSLFNDPVPVPDDIKTADEFVQWAKSRATEVESND